DVEGDSHERALAAGEQREPLDLLARGARLDLEPRRQQVVGIGEDEPSLTAREEPLEDALELDSSVLEGLGEDALDPLVDLPDDVEEVALGALEVLELLGEELVPLLEGRELLEREGVDAA